MFSSVKCWLKSGWENRGGWRRRGSISLRAGSGSPPALLLLGKSPLFRSQPHYCHCHEAPEPSVCGRAREQPSPPELIILRLGAWIAAWHWIGLEWSQCLFANSLSDFYRKKVKKKQNIFLSFFFRKQWLPMPSWLISVKLNWHERFTSFAPGSWRKALTGGPAKQSKVNQKRKTKNKSGTHVLHLDIKVC